MKFDLLHNHWRKTFFLLSFAEIIYGKLCDIVWHGHHGDRFNCWVLYGFWNGAVWTRCKWHFQFDSFLTLIVNGSARGLKVLTVKLILGSFPFETFSLTLKIFLPKKTLRRTSSTKKLHQGSSVHDTWHCQLRDSKVDAWLTLLSVRQLRIAIHNKKKLNETISSV